MSQGLKKVTILFIYLFCLAKSYSQLNELPEYGFVIGDKCGQVIDTDFSNGHLSIHISFPETKTLCGKLNGNTLTGTFEGQPFTMTFESNGNGEGLLRDGTHILMVEGSKVTDDDNIELLESRGLTKSFYSFLTDHGFILDDAIGIYHVVNTEQISITVIFGKNGKDLFPYPNRQRVNTLTYSKGKWSFLLH